MKDYEAYNDQLFSRWAPVYDGFELILHGVRNKVLREIDSSNKTVLDVATGTGSLALALSDTAKKVVGIDLSEQMLKVARKKKGSDKLAFLQMDASEMDFPDQEFDIVTISLGLHDMPLEIRTAVLKEAKRVLKKDGKLYILEYDLPPSKFVGFCSSHFINIYESKYYIEFIQADFAAYLKSLGFKIECKTNYLMKHLQLLRLSA